MSSASYDWLELHQTPSLNGYASNSPLSSLTASQFGVGWATNLYGSTLDSPVVAFNPTLAVTLGYIGTETGNVLAINLANGHIVWGTWLGSPIRATPLVNNGSVYVATFSTPAVYRINATTGAIDCSFVSAREFEATPTLATPPGGAPTLYIGSLDSGTNPGPFYAINAEDCNLEWEFTGYHVTAGSWDAASYGVTGDGGPTVLFGTDNPDSSVYALNATTGQEVWRFQTYNPGNEDFDVAAGASISPPGKYGFPQGAAFVTNKAGRAYALDLNNGSLIWETNFDAIAGLSPGNGEINGLSRSTPALDGTNMIFGYAQGLVDLDARKGGLIWMYNDSTLTESIASPAIAGGSGHGIVVTGDVGGDVDVVSVARGTPLYSYQTGGYITGSPAVAGGNILVSSANGFLYDFAVGGGDDSVLPTTSIDSPTQGVTLANPDGNLTITGTATDVRAVDEVNVAVESGGAGGQWWDAANRSWSPGPVDDSASLVTPGGLSTSWNISFPVPQAGGVFEVTAYAVSSSGQSDLTGSEVSFVVLYRTSGPYLKASSEFVAPGGTVTVNGGGFGASQPVTLTLFGDTIATVMSSISGSLPSTRLTVRATSRFGLTSITATDTKSGQSSTANLTITNIWDQFGNGPGHVGYERNDPTLNTLIFPGGNNWLKVAWDFDAGAPLNASPAIVDGVAYVADTAGQLFAVDLHNGGVIWTFTLTSGRAIMGSPAVDPSLGLVLVGANDGTVDAIFLSNGTLAWSTSVGGNISAPIYADGIVYAASSIGTVVALAEPDGVEEWSVALGGSITSAPSLNNSAGLLVVGDSDGKVVGLNATTGASRWSYATGGAVTASATISGGWVYIGSSDHKVYALNESTGAKRWTFKTGAAVQDTGSLLDKYSYDAVPDLYIGSNDGKLYVLRASNGKDLLTYPMGSPIVGVSTLKGVVLFETAGGVVSGARAAFNLDGWNYTTSGDLVTSPTVIDGAVYVAAGDGCLYAFTSDGQPPI
ncbi:MAG: PQQ-binding-like beta-propeller repeat protein [Thermoplasmata archaeon]